MKYKEYKERQMNDLEIAKEMLEQHRIPYHETVAGLILTPALVPGWMIEFGRKGELEALYHQNYRNLDFMQQDIMRMYHRHNIDNFTVCDVVHYIIGHDQARMRKKGLLPLCAQEKKQKAV